MPENSGGGSSHTGPKPVPVCLLGGVNSGKTCFIGGLALLADPNAPSELCVTGLDSDTVAYLEELGTTLRSQQWPPATSRMLKPLKLRLGLGGDLVELWTLDYGGENFENEIKRLSPDTLAELREHLHTAETLFLLFDPLLDLGYGEEEATEGARSSGAELKIQRQTAHLQAIDWIWSTRQEQSSRARKIDLAIILTKCDAEPYLQTPAAVRDFFRRQAPGLDAKLRERADHLGYFPLSAVGSTATNRATDRQVPAPQPRPYGYTEIVRWVIRRRRIHRWSPFARTLTAALILIAAGALLWWGYETFRCSSSEAILAERDQSVARRLERTADCPCETVRVGRIRLTNQRLGDLNQALLQSQSPGTLDATVLPELRALQTAVPVEKRSEVDTLLQAVDSRRRQLRYEEVKVAAAAEASDLPEIIRKFVEQFPGSPHAEEAQRFLATWRKRKYERSVGEVRAQDTLSPSGLAAKGRLLARLLTDYEPQLLAAGRPIPVMRRAAVLADQFSKPRDYVLILKRSGGFEKSRKQAIKLFVNDELVRTYRSLDASLGVHWPREPLTIRWSSGVPIRVELWGKATLREELAAVGHHQSGALVGLAFKTELSVVESWQKDCISAFAEFDIEGLSADDLRAYQRFISPGDEL